MSCQCLPVSVCLSGVCRRCPVSVCLSVSACLACVGDVLSVSACLACVGDAFSTGHVPGRGDTSAHHRRWRPVTRHWRQTRQRHTLEEPICDRQKPLQNTGTQLQTLSTHCFIAPSGRYWPWYYYGIKWNSGKFSHIIKHLMPKWSIFGIKVPSIKNISWI